MPVFRESSRTIGEDNNLRRPRSQFKMPISESTYPNPLIHSTGCKSSISSILLSTFSSTTINDTNTVTQNKKKSNFKSATFRGLGCTASASSNVSVPEAIGSSVDWEENKARKQKKKKNLKKKMNIINNNREVAAIEDVWCGPGIGFSDDVVGSVDCVVARTNLAPSFRIGEIVNHNQREHPVWLGRRTVNPVPESIPLLDSDPAFVLTCPSSEVFDTRYFAHAQHPSPRGLAEIMMLENNLLMGGRYNTYDQFHDWRLDVDNMSYEELLDLSDLIGYVSTGLREDEIGRCVRKIKHSNGRSSKLFKHTEQKCTICQDEFQADDDLGKLNCGHSHHLPCIKQWLAHKNACPVCKTVALVRH